MTTIKERNERNFDNLITSELITTNKNKYRLTVEYYGAYTDNEPNPTISTGALISIYELTRNNPETITDIYNTLAFEAYDDATIEESSVYFEDFISEAHTIETVKRIKELLQIIEG